MSFMISFAWGFSRNPPDQRGGILISRILYRENCRNVQDFPKIQQQFKYFQVWGSMSRSMWTSGLCRAMFKTSIAKLRNSAAA